MAAYTRQGECVSLLLSKAEAQALRDFGNYGADATADDGTYSPQTRQAGERALSAINAACDSGARSGARFD